MPRMSISSVLGMLTDALPITLANGQTTIGPGTELPITINTDHVVIEISAPALTVATLKIEAQYSGTTWGDAGLSDLSGAVGGLVGSITALAGGTLRYLYRPVAGVTRIRPNVTSRTAGSVTVRMIERKKV